MTEQITNLFEQPTRAATDALTELRRALTTESLFHRLEEATEPLRGESAEKAAQSETLKQSHKELEPRVKAKLRVLRGEIDSALASGLDAVADGKRRESEDLAASLENILAQAQACDARIRELDAEHRQKARELFEQTFPEIRTALVMVQQALCKTLDDAWTDIQHFGEETGNQNWPHLLVRETHRADLTAREEGPERALFNRLKHWFGGRL